MNAAVKSPESAVYPRGSTPFTRSPALCALCAKEEIYFSAVTCRSFQSLLFCDLSNFKKVSLVDYQ
jgi:hypothetical protein